MFLVHTTRVVHVRIDFSGVIEVTIVGALLLPNVYHLFRDRGRLTDEGHANDNLNH